MANIQVTFDSDVNNARSESSLVVNPINPMRVGGREREVVSVDVVELLRRKKNDANARAAQRFINGPGCKCGDPRPWQTNHQQLTS